MGAKGYGVIYCTGCEEEYLHCRRREDGLDPTAQGGTRIKDGLKDQYFNQPHGGNEGLFHISLNGFSGK